MRFEFRLAPILRRTLDGFRGPAGRVSSVWGVALIGLGCGSSDAVSPAPQTLDGEWVRLSYGSGSSVSVAVVRPTGYSAQGNHPVIVALPWGSGSADLVLGMIDAYWDDEALDRGFLVVSPAILGPNLATEASELLPALFGWMDQNLSYDPNRVVLVGASNGGRGIFHALAAAPERFHALIGMPGAYSGPAAALASFSGNPAWLLVGEDDASWRAPAESTKLLLEAQGIPTRLDVVPGQGHVLLLDQRELMDWIDDALSGV